MLGSYAVELARLLVFFTQVDSVFTHQSCCDQLWVFIGVVWYRREERTQVSPEDAKLSIRSMIRLNASSGVITLVWESQGRKATIFGVRGCGSTEYCTPRKKSPFTAC